MYEKASKVAQNLLFAGCTAIAGLRRAKDISEQFAVFHKASAAVKK